jgi:hypothetical protein
MFFLKTIQLKQIPIDFPSLEFLRDLVPCCLGLALRL